MFRYRPHKRIKHFNELRVNAEMEPLNLNIFCHFQRGEHLLCVKIHYCAQQARIIFERYIYPIFDVHPVKIVPVPI